jgi:hypothetical protein
MLPLALFLAPGMKLEPPPPGHRAPGKIGMPAGLGIPLTAPTFAPIPGGSGGQRALLAVMAVHRRVGVVTRGHELRVQADTQRVRAGGRWHQFGTVGLLTPICMRTCPRVGAGGRAGERHETYSVERREVIARVGSRRGVAAEFVMRDVRLDPIVERVVHVVVRIAVRIQAIGNLLSDETRDIPIDGGRGAGEQYAAHHASGHQILGDCVFLHSRSPL